jgi:hypothetical protein
VHLGPQLQEGYATRDLFSVVCMHALE